MGEPKTFSEVLALWGSIEIFSKDMGIAHEVVARWAREGYIPRSSWGTIIRSKVGIEYKITWGKLDTMERELT